MPRTSCKSLARPQVALRDLHRTFVRLRARRARQGRQVRQLREEMEQGAVGGDKDRRGAAKAARPAAYSEAWAKWSATADELAETVEMILRYPPRTVPDLVIKFDALSWALLSDSAVVDHQAERQVRAFGQQLRQLAAAGG